MSNSICRCGTPIWPTDFLCISCLEKLSEKYINNEKSMYRKNFETLESGCWYLQRNGNLILLQSDWHDWYNKDGTWFDYDSPEFDLIQKIEPPVIKPLAHKKKIKKTLTYWVNIYPNEFNKLRARPAYFSREMADACAEDRIACVELTGEYEVEVPTISDYIEVKE